MGAAGYGIEQGLEQTETEVVSADQLSPATKVQILLLATGKSRTYDAMREFIAANPEYTDTFEEIISVDPELSAKELVSANGTEETVLYPAPHPEAFDAEEEPRGSAQQAVEFKLSRAMKLFEENPELAKSYTILAVDVGARINGIENHKLLRTYEDEQLYQKDGEGRKQEDLKALKEMYGSGPFFVTWEIAYGMINDGQQEISSVFVFAEYPALPDELISEYYNARTNTGVQLVEAAKKLGDQVKFVVVDENGNTIEADGKVVYGLVVDKIPPAELFKQLFLHQIEKEEVVAAPAALGLLQQFQ